MDLKDLISKIKNLKFKDSKMNKKMFNLIVIILVGAILIMAGNSFKTSEVSGSVTEIETEKNTKINPSYNIKDTQEYEASIQQELKNKLERVDGVGRVDVMIYFECGEEQVPAVNVNNSDSITNEEDTTGGTRKIAQNNNDKTIVVTNDNGTNKPLIVKRYKPKITGALIVAEGAEDKVTELRINKAVCTLFNLPQNKVNVYPMKK